ncbi:MAG: oxygen-independent coproporphyrinogen III oxidase [Cyanobacteriota bacterium]
MNVATPLDLLLKYDRPVPRYTSYPTATAFDSAVGPEHLRELLGAAADSPLSLYVHVPFCRHACWYCGCHRVTTQAGSKAVGPYLEALAQIHWGGGTPNYLDDHETGELWERIARHFQLENDLEASIEVNPEFLTRQRILQLRQLGFNRISFGIQDADPEVQKAVNRVVPVDQLRRVMGWIREAEFSSVNVDLICGLPLQTPERLHSTLALVKELRPERVSLFSFAYLPEQLPLQRNIRPEDLPDQHERLQMLDDAHRELGSSGYEAIGMDHYALAGDSLAIAAREGRLHRNFQGYTTGGHLDLLGLGPTAISMFPHLFSQNQRNLKAYYASLQAGILPVERGLVVQDPDLLERRAIIQEVMCRFRVTLDPERHASEWADLQALSADGLVQLSRGIDGMALMEVTPRGRWLIRTVAAVFDPSQKRKASGSRLI